MVVGQISATMKGKETQRKEGDDEKSGHQHMSNKKVVFTKKSLL